MARNDGIDRTVARNQDLGNPADVAKVQEHNKREKDSYSNQDIVPERTSLNVHFKAPTDDYVKMFEQMEQDGVISTRGLKLDAVKLQKVQDWIKGKGSWMGFFVFLPGIGDFIAVALGFLRANIWIVAVSMFLGKAIRYWVWMEFVYKVQGMF